MTHGVCRECGCTDDRPCIVAPDVNDLVEFLDDAPSTCSWVEADLCSACATPEDVDEGQRLDDLIDRVNERGSLIVDAYGNPYRGKGR